MQKKERQFLLSNKIAQDATRRLRLSYQESEKLKRELEVEKGFHATKDRDLNQLKVEFKEIQESERNLREERSRTLNVCLFVWLITNESYLFMVAYSKQI